MGTCTFAQLGTAGQTGVDDYWGQRRIKFGVLTMSTSYATTGDSILVSAFGMDAIDQIIFTTPAQASGGGTTAVILSVGQSISLPLDPGTATVKVQAYWAPASTSTEYTEVNSTTNLSTYAAQCIVIGV